MILQRNSIMNINPSANPLPLPHQPAWTTPYSTCEGFFATQWHDVHPQYWTKYQVWEWLQQLVDTNQLDASCIAFQEFDITGERLCSMTLHDFTLAAGEVGHILYNSVHNLKWHGNYGSQVLQSLNVVIKTEQADHSSMVPWKDSGYLYETCYDDVYDSKLYCRNNLSMTPNQYTTDRSEGVFRFLKSEAVAQLWGKKKNNSSMTYEKLSRAMRYYYKREILERVDGRRLVYKFGKNARGWRENDS
uniref:ETS homologous factor n=1 Tax=Pyxicephalus adspersus TaxID=30357 RepID=A0AAV3A6H2_PYXAD|nr:TPA: hypothetical protein GDO54_002970 [Pyxicephalus adspersus]